METAKELEIMLDIEELGQEGEEAREKFVVNDDNKACWVFKKIKQLQEEIQQKKDLAESQHQQISDWLKKETEQRQNSIEYFESLLREYGYKLKEKDSKLKTHSLPFGDLKFRKQQPEWKYEDDKLLESVKEIWGGESGLIKVKETVNKALLKKHNDIAITDDGRLVLPATGEVIEGVTVTERPEKFEIKVK